MSLENPNDAASIMDYGEKINTSDNKTDVWDIEDDYFSDQGNEYVVWDRVAKKWSN